MARCEPEPFANGVRINILTRKLRNRFSHFICLHCNYVRLPVVGCGTDAPLLNPRLQSPSNRAQYGSEKCGTMAWRRSGKQNVRAQKRSSLPSGRTTSLACLPAEQIQWSRWLPMLPVIVCTRDCIARLMSCGRLEMVGMWWCVQSYPIVGSTPLTDGRSLIKKPSSWGRVEGYSNGIGKNFKTNV